MGVRGITGAGREGWPGAEQAEGGKAPEDGRVTGCSVVVREDEDGWLVSVE